MRVISGALGGRRLASPPGGTRPTSDRVREALFSTLGPVEGMRVLDLFAGSGALAMEALSRGASQAVLVEKDRRTARVAGENIETLGLDDRATLVVGRAEAELARLARDGEQVGLVFADPPYRQGLETLRGLSAGLSRVVAPGGRIVVESHRRDPAALDLPMVHERQYGDTAIRIHAAPQ